MLKKIITFIKYNTFTAIIIAVAFVAVASAVASNENIKKNVLGEEVIEKNGVDNSTLLAADLANFDLAMEITNVTEDSESSNNSENNKTGNYYIDYQYETLGIQDDVWRKILRQKQMVISKAALDGRDLGLYASEELGEIIDNEIAYLKEVRKNEEEKGQTFVKETTKYTGLIGMVLDTKTKELPGYEPVVKPPEIVVQPEPAPINQPEPTDPTTPTPPLEGGDYGDFASAPENGSPYYLWLVKNCMNNGKYWYNDTCNAEPETAVPDDSDSDQENPKDSESSKNSESESEPAPDEVSKDSESSKNSESESEPAPVSEAEDLGDQEDEGEKGNEGDLILN